MTDSVILCKYFADSSNGDLVLGQSVVWSWEQWGDYPVKVIHIEPNRLIQLRLNSDQWKKTETDGYEVDILLEFESLENDETQLTISESGWKDDPPGRKASHENCSGWTHMAMCLKAYLEHEIDLR